MSTQIWIANAAAVAQVTTLTPASSSVGDAFKVTCNGKSVSYATAAGTVADVCNGLATALANCVYPEFKEFTPQNTGTSITLTGNSAGKPFTVSTSVTTSGTATLTSSTPTAATGPNDWANGANWSTGSAPVAGDDVYFNGGSVPCLYNLAQSAVTLNSLTVLQAYAGTIGLPLTNPAGYNEYRTLELQVSATTMNIGQGTTGNGSGRLKFNVGANACTLNVYNTGQPLDPGIPAFTWKGSSGSNVININKGNVGIAPPCFPGSTASVATLRTGYVTNQNSDVNLVCGPGCTLTTVTQNGGVVVLNSGVTTLTVYAATCTVNGTGAIGTLNCYGGTTYYNSTGALGATAVNLYETGILDFSQDQQAKTVSGAITRYTDSSAINDPFKVVASLSVKNDGSDLSKLNIGENLTVTRS